MRLIYILLACILSVSTLHAASQPDTLILQPGPAEGTDCEVRTDAPDFNRGDWFDFIANAWTAQGNFFVMRSFIRFDLSSIPTGSTVQSATLDLYTNLNTGHYQLDSGPNTAYLMRVLNHWDEHLLTWNNQPAVSIDDTVILPQSTSNTQSYHPDVTAHVQEMVNHPDENFGWMFRLETEEIYRCMVFASSDHPEEDWRPRLTVIYSPCDPPVADFSFEVTDKTVAFTDLSQGAVTWRWDFGDGDTSTLQNPVHAYDLPGTYPVLLEITDSCGQSVHRDTVSITCEGPQAGFYEYVYFPEVEFHDTSVSATPHTWLWEFGDGETSSLQNPVHSYADTGMYLVCLTTTDSCSSHTACHQVGVFPAPMMLFSFSVIGTASLEIQFTDLTTGSDHWFWEFGDGAASTAQNPSHTYSKGGTYQVCLTAGKGSSSTTGCDSLTLSGKPSPQRETRLYPNPVTGRTILISPGKETPALEATVYDLTGRNVLQETFGPVKAAATVSLPLSGLRQGIYFVKLDYNSTEETFRIILL